MIYITGDIHGNFDIHKLSSRHFREGKNLTRSDYVIICGDFGLLFDGSEEEKAWLKWLDEKPWTTLWIDGNHENFDMLAEYGTEEWNGCRVQKITENIIHLCRGSFFELEGKKFFAFGGAESHDKEYRVIGESLWLDEMPDETDFENGIKSLDKAGWKADIVITHSLPDSIQRDIFGDDCYASNALTEYFDMINERLEFNMWFSGHYHVSAEYGDKHYLIYNSIVQLTDTGFIRVYPAFIDEGVEYELPDIRW